MQEKYELPRRSGQNVKNILSMAIEVPESTRDRGDTLNDVERPFRSDPATK